MPAVGALLLFPTIWGSQPLFTDDSQLVVPPFGGVGGGKPRLRRLWCTGAACRSLWGPTLAPPVPTRRLMAATPSPRRSGVSDGERAAVLPRAPTPATTPALCEHQDRLCLLTWLHHDHLCNNCRAELCWPFRLCMWSSPMLTCSRRLSSVGRIIPHRQRLQSTAPPMTRLVCTWRLRWTLRPPSQEQQRPMIRGFGIRHFLLH